VWIVALGRGTLLRPDTQAQRLGNGSPSVPGVVYDFAIHDVNGWLGHDGDVPGYLTAVGYLPERDASLVIFANSDVPEQDSADQIAYNVTSIVAPEHLYQAGPTPPELPDNPNQ